MIKAESFKWGNLQEKLHLIKKALEYQKEHQVEVAVPIELDVTGKKVHLEQAMVTYHINKQNKENMDYLVVNDLKHAVRGLYTNFTGYDTSADTGWDSWNDEYQDGSIIEEEWYWEAEEREEFDVNIEVENSEELLNDLTDKGLRTSFDILVRIQPESIKVELRSEDLINPENPYLEHKDVVDVMQYLLKLDTRENGHPDVEKVYLKMKEKRNGIEDINTEVLKNMKVVLSHEKFQNLIRDYTHQEEDISTLYLKTRGKVATLSRFFRGYNYNVNTVHGLPLTMTTHYQVEDKEVTLNPADTDWKGESLSGRYPRMLHNDNDYHKYTSFIRHHFPSLLTQEGTLEGIELSVAFGDVTPEKVLINGGKGTILVVGTNNQGVGNKEQQVLAGVKVEYSGMSHKKPIDANAFYKEYQEFVNWENKNLN